MTAAQPSARKQLPVAQTRPYWFVVPPYTYVSIVAFYKVMFCLQCNIYLDARNRLVILSSNIFPVAYVMSKEAKRGSFEFEINLISFFFLNNIFLADKLYCVRA